MRRQCGDAEVPPSSLLSPVGGTCKAQVGEADLEPSVGRQGTTEMPRDSFGTSPRTFLSLAIRSVTDAFMVSTIWPRPACCLIL